MRDEILAYKRERILQEAVKLFYERGFTGTTLDDIAAALGVTKPFIYTHFKSKVELLAALCLPTIEMSMDAAAEAAGSPGTPTERLRRLVGDFTRVILQRQANIAVFFREEKHLTDEARAEIATKQKGFDRILTKLLREGVQTGDFHITDPSLTSLAIGGMISWAYTWHRPNGRLGLEEMAARMSDLALQMAGARQTVTAN